MTCEESGIDDTSAVDAVYGTDIYTEPDAAPDTLSHLGPLAPLAGVWSGTRGADEHPEVVRHRTRTPSPSGIELQPIDAQTNGPQLFFGLRYHTHIVRPGEIETFHDQVGYWLWEPATHTVTLTLGIPRGQVLLAGGTAAPDAVDFEVRAAVGSEIYGILSNPFLDANFRTLSYRMHVTVHPDGTWSVEEEGVLEIPGQRGAVLARRPEHADPHHATHPQPTGRSECVPGTLGIGSLRHEGRSSP